MAAIAVYPCRQPLTAHVATRPRDAYAPLQPTPCGAYVGERTYGSRTTARVRAGARRALLLSVLSAE